MTRLWIIILMIIGFSGMANAQGTWVLWERKSIDTKQVGLDDLPNETNTMNLSEAYEWEPIKSFTALNFCEEERMKNCERYFIGRGRCPDWAAVVIKEIDTKSKQGFRMKAGSLEWRCLPDTIDPRK
jgi:hypothetical protein